MPAYPYHLVDVFTQQPFGGNQLAIFVLEDGNLTDTTMQAIASELNLSETTFVLPPTDGTSDHHVRIFTPAIELPMAGHPTVGTAFVLARLGLVTSPGNVTFQEGVGPIPVALSGTGDDIVATMTQPRPTFGKVWEDRTAIAELVSLTEADLLPEMPVQVVSTGVPFLYIPLRSLNAIRRATLRMDLWQSEFVGYIPQMYLFTTETEDPAATTHARMFAPGMGIAEDPATGAACGPLGAYLVRYGLAAPGVYLNEQGYEMGRSSQVYIRAETNGDDITVIQVGGHCVYMGRGELILPG